MKWSCLLILLLCILIRCYWKEDDFFSFSWFYCWLMVGMVRHVDDFQKIFEKDNIINAYMMGFLKRLFFFDIPNTAKHRRELAKASVIPVYVFTTMSKYEKYETIKGTMRLLGIRDLGCVTCRDDIYFSTRIILRENCTECFCCFYHRYSEESLRIFLLIRELPWLIENEQFSEKLFLFYTRLCRFRLTTGDSSRNPPSKYHKFLELVPDFECPRWLHDRNGWYVYSPESLELVPLLQILEKRPVESKREEIFQEGMRALCLEEGGF